MCMCVLGVVAYCCVLWCGVVCCGVLWCVNVAESCDVVRCCALLFGVMLFLCWSW